MFAAEGGMLLWRRRSILLYIVLLMGVALVYVDQLACVTKASTKLFQEFHLQQPQSTPEQGGREGFNLRGMDDNDEVAVDNDLLLDYQYGGKERVELALERLPSWVGDYAQWHKEQRSKPPTNETKYLLSPCLTGDLCGGISDRLRILTFLLVLANQTQRVLLLQWTKPCPLEEFLIPPEGGLDWRVRTEDNIEKSDINGGGTNVCGIIPWSKYENILTKCVSEFAEREQKHGTNRKRVISLRMPSDIGARAGHVLFQDIARKSTGEQTNTATSGDDVYMKYFGEVFRLMFEPTEPLARQFHATMETLNLNVGNFVSAHLRARYPDASELRATRNATSQWSDPFRIDKVGGLSLEGETKEIVTGWASNAIKCAASLAPGLPVYFSSDSNETLSHTIHTYRDERERGRNTNKTLPESVLVVGMEKDEPLHIDHDPNTGKVASEFYSGFVDLLVMGSGRCVAYGLGGFGAFGAALSGRGGQEAPCRAQHRYRNGQKNKCG